jgi:hypothetical protein
MKRVGRKKRDGREISVCGEGAILTKWQRDFIEEVLLYGLSLYFRNKQ